MLDRYLTTPCVIRTPMPDAADSTTDEDGVPVVAMSTVATTCHLQPYRAEDEDIMGRAEAQRARRAWFSAGTLIEFSSTVEVDGEPFTVWGDPETWSIGSHLDHVAVVLVRQLSNEATGGSS